MQINGPIPDFYHDKDYYKVIFVDKFNYYIVLHEDDSPVVGKIGT